MPRNPDKIDYTGGLPVGFERFTIVEDPRTGGNTKLFWVLDTKTFSKCVASHVGDLYPELAQQLIAVDGKSLRGSGVKTAELDPLPS